MSNDIDNKYPIFYLPLQICADDYESGVSKKI